MIYAKFFVVFQFYFHILLFCSFFYIANQKSILYVYNNDGWTDMSRKKSMFWIKPEKEKMISLDRKKKKANKYLEEIFILICMLLIRLLFSRSFDLHRLTLHALFTYIVILQYIFFINKEIHFFLYALFKLHTIIFK